MSRTEGATLMVNYFSPSVHGHLGELRMVRLSQHACGLLACTYPLFIASGNKRGWSMTLYTRIQNPFLRVNLNCLEKNPAK